MTFGTMELIVGAEVEEGPLCDFRSSSNVTPALFTGLLCA